MPTRVRELLWDLHAIYVVGEKSGRHVGCWRRSGPGAEARARVRDGLRNDTRSEQNPNMPQNTWQTPPPPHKPRELRKCSTCARTCLHGRFPGVLDAQAGGYCPSLADVCEHMARIWPSWGEHGPISPPSWPDSVQSLPRSARLGQPPPRKSPLSELFEHMFSNFTAHARRRARRLAIWQVSARPCLRATRPALVAYLFGMCCARFQRQEAEQN